jgi:hypothetical protein
VPVVLWFDPKNSTYGQNIQTGYIDSDSRASSFTLESDLTLDAPANGAPPVSELGDEKFGLPDGLPVIRFTPDGFFDYVSVPQLVIHQGTEAALQLVPTTDRLSYEIRPFTSS